MSNWETVTIGSHVQIERGFAFKSEDYRTEGRFILRVTNISEGGKIEPKDAVFLDKKKISLFSNYQLDEGDILLVMVGATTGKIGRVSSQVLPAVLNQNIWNLKPSNDTLFKQFFYFTLHDIIERFLASSQGSAREFLKQSDFHNISFKLPPLPHQRKIAKILTTVDNLIEKTEQLIAKYQSIKQGMMHDLFTRGVDANGKLRPPQSEAPELYKQSELGWIPMEWDVGFLKNVATVIVGGTPSTNAPLFWGGNIPWMASGDIHLQHIYDVSGRITELGLKCSNAVIVEPKAIAMALAGQGKTRGTVAITHIPICTNQSVALIKTQTNKLDPDFLYQALVIRYEEMRSRSSGGGRGGLTKAIIEAIPILLPPLSQQYKIAEILSKQDMLIEDYEKELMKNKQLKTALMQDLLTGKVQVTPDAEDKELAHA